VETFLADSSANAYEKVVDRLLNPHATVSGWRSAGWMQLAMLTPTATRAMGFEYVALA
jgi:hypothetical protein